MSPAGTLSWPSKRKGLNLSKINNLFSYGTTTITCLRLLRVERGAENGDNPCDIQPDRGRGAATDDRGVQACHAERRPRSDGEDEADGISRLDARLRMRRIPAKGVRNAIYGALPSRLRQGARRADA